MLNFHLGALVTCENYGNCIVSSGAVGCCPGGLEAECEFQNICIDYVAFYTSSACPQGCQMDPNTLKWYLHSLTLQDF